MNCTRLLLVACCALAAPLLAQEAPPAAEPTPEHQWLEKFSGEWEVTNKAFDPDGNEIMTCEGSYSARMLGSFWLIGDAIGEWAGTKVHAVQTIGYDSEHKQYVGTWIDSVSDHMWEYTGSLNESKTKLTLEAEGPNFMGDGKMTKFRDAYEFKSPDHIVATSSMLGNDGKWVEFMRGDMVRAKDQ